MAKKMNMSFEELNQFRVNDFLKTFNIFSGQPSNKEKSGSNIREATQKDIDTLLS